MTMVKLAMALDGAVHVHIADRRAHSRWHDEMPGEPVASTETSSVPKRAIGRHRKKQAE